MPPPDDGRIARLARERRLFTAGPDGPLSVCLIYPNTYRVGMANLGFQAVYRLLSEDPRVTVDRAFLPDGEPSTWPRTLRSLEQDRAVRDFDVIAFSISFETDYVNLVRCLALAGVPVWQRDRRERTPLVLAGGPATFLNPEPIADFVDLFLIGEAEEMLDAFVARALDGARGRDAVLERAETVPGAYRPSRWTPEYDAAGDLAGVAYAGAGPARVERQYLRDLDRFRTTSEVIAPDAVFGDMYLVEASRGCEWGCRFCAAGYMYRPVRYRSLAHVRESAARGLVERGTVGLVGAEMASFPGIAAVCQEIAAAGGRASPSSLKADIITPALAHALGANGNRSVTVAPEAGSERMRRVINKNLTEPEILRAAEWLVGGGVDSLKLYVMVGLPTETEADVDGIVALAGALRRRLAVDGRSRVGRILVSVNPFVPKPWTPFQWEPMEAIPVLRRKLAGLRKAVGALPGVDMEAESPREAYLQTLLSRGDRRVAPIVARLAERPDAWWPTLTALRGGAGDLVDPDRFVHRAVPVDAVLPWDFIDHAVDKRYLAAERRKAFAELQTPPCDTATCHSCGAC